MCHQSGGIIRSSGKNVSLVACHIYRHLISSFLIRQPSNIIRPFEWGLVRPFSLRRDTGDVSTLAILPVKGGRVARDTVVPNHDSPWRPFHTSLQVLAQRNVVVQELEEPVALLLLHAYDAAGELLVDEERLFARGRVRADDGMDVLDRLPSHLTTSQTAGVCLLDSGVYRFEAVQSLLECRGQPVVRFDHVCEECVASCAGILERVQERGPMRKRQLAARIRVGLLIFLPWWLLFKGDI